MKKQYSFRNITRRSLLRSVGIAPLTNPLLPLGAAQPANQKTEWWANLPLHHDHWIPVGGLGEAALALLGEVDTASEWAAWAKADFEAPATMHFDNQEIVILRTGWENTSSVVSLSCGPLAGQQAARYIRSGHQLSQGNSHHSHADYGAFSLFACGQYFVVPPGYARRGSSFQNVVSVNGNPLLAAVTLTRPEWYKNRMHVLALFSWMERPSVPKAILQKEVWGITWEEVPDRPAIVFASSTDQVPDLQGIVHDKREVLLFGLRSAPDILRL